ncbi:hypothetical protein [Egbenema bharatensis]|uniref:hypothetical protein n=1 Tax=Egbenema bharatensis TaxID=3463334 RepID=UPI003A8A548D
MQVKWKTLITKVSVWLLLELSLNLLGVDQLADYSEFLSHPASVHPYGATIALAESL